MPKFTYFIFLLMFGQLKAMETSSTLADSKKGEAHKVIAVINGLKYGVIAHVYDADKGGQHNSERKIWLRSVSMGHITVSPPKSPTAERILAIKDSDDTQVLAQTSFAHPVEELHFGVVHTNDGVSVDPLDLAEFRSFSK